MHKLMAMPIAGLLALALAAPVAAGQTTYNSTSSAITAQAGRDSYDEATGTYEWEWISAWQTNGDPAYIELYGGSFREIVCTSARRNQPATTAYLESFRYGFGEGALTVGRKYSSASASGTIEIWSETYNGCTGEYTSTFIGAAAVTLQLTGSGSLVMERGAWSFKVPGEYNGHSSYSSTYRSASGTASVDGTSNAVNGRIGKVSWKDHSNG